MKNILVTLIILLFISCNEQNTKTDNSEWSGTISASDERNDLVNKFVDAYENKDSEAALSIFSDDAVFNVNDSKLTPKETIEGFMLGHEYFDGIKNVDRQTMTMFYNNGDIYTNYWYTWNGINKKTSELLVIRGYAWFKWEGMKVVESYNAFDPTEYNKAFE